MQLVRLRIRNYKVIRDMEICDIENALILVGKNNTGKTSVLDAIRVVSGVEELTKADFNEAKQNVEIEVTLEITPEDRRMMHRAGIVSRYKRYEIWENDFYRKLPSCKGDLLEFTYTANYEGTVRYTDGIKKDNPCIREVLPRLHYINTVSYTHLK